MSEAAELAAQLRAEAAHLRKSVAEHERDPRRRRVVIEMAEQKEREAGWLEEEKGPPESGAAP